MLKKRSDIKNSENLKSGRNKTFVQKLRLISTDRSDFFFKNKNHEKWEHN